MRLALHGACVSNSHDLQCLTTQLPLIPHIIAIDVFLDKVNRGLGAHVFVLGWLAVSTDVAF